MSTTRTSPLLEIVSARRRSRGRFARPPRGLMPWLAAIMVMLCSAASVARAQSELPEPVREALGATVEAVLTEEDWAGLAVACPYDDAHAFVDCLGRDERARPILAAAQERGLQALSESLGEGVVQRHGEVLLSLSEEGLRQLAQACAEAADLVACADQVLAGGAEPTALDGPEAQGDGAQPDDYPQEALALLPREVLDALPRALTAFLRPADYQALREACPQEDLEATLTCLESETTLELLDTLHTRAVIASILEYMDHELPSRLGPESLDALGDRCAEPGEAWAGCVFEKGLDGDPCFEHEDTLARCLIEDDHVTAVYLVLQADKKQIFGPELYVEFRGLLSVLTLDDIRALRQACPQADQEALYECLADNELVQVIVEAFVEGASEIVQQVQHDLVEAGNPLDQPQIEAHIEHLVELLLTFPVRALDSLAVSCMAQHPDPEQSGFVHPDELTALLSCISEGSHTDPVANPAYISTERLRAWLGLARAKVIERLRDQEESAQARSFSYILVILSVFGAIGFVVVLLMPLSLTRRYPDRRAQLWKASAIAAVTFVVTVALLGATLLVMRTVQGKVAIESTSPRMVVANGVFDVLEQDQYVEELSALSRERLDFIKTPLRTVIEASGGGPDARYLSFSAFVSEHWVDQLREPELRPLAKNIQMLEEHVDRFKSVFALYRRVDWLMGYVPLVLSLLAVVLYMIPLRQTLVTIATAPARAAQGGGEGMVRRALATVLAEIKLVLPFLGVMVVLLLATGVFLSLAVEPLIEVLMGFSFLTVLYILLTEASGFVLYASLGGSIVLLVACIAVYVVAMIVFIGTMRRVLRARFHWGQPLARYRSFWGVGTLATTAVLLFPVLFAALARWVALEYVLPEVDVEGGRITAMDMLLVPLGGALLMPLVFWAARGVKALGWVKGYRVARDDEG